MGQSPTARWTWQCSSSAQRADKAITNALDERLGTWEGEPQRLSRSRVQDLIRNHFILVNSNPIQPNTQLNASDQITLQLENPTPSLLRAVALEGIQILFQDDHIVIVDKPQGISVHPSTTESSGTLVNHLLSVIPDLKGIGGEERPGIVHRIDKMTSGVLVVAKSQEAHARLVEIFSKHEIERKYWALCYSSLGGLNSEHRIESLIGRNPNDRLKMTTEVKTGKKAVSHFKVLENFRGKNFPEPIASWIEAKLETGRTHQVRVHLTLKGASLMGDPLYGKPSENHSKWRSLPVPVQEAIDRLPGQALHARSLGFHHPISNQWVYFEALPPRLFTELYDTLKDKP